MAKKVTSATTKLQQPGFGTSLRRILALIYELLPTSAILFLATVLVAPLMNEDHVTAGSLWFQLYLLAVLYLYFVWCWMHGGQTLGMRAWRLVVVGPDHQPLGWRDASIRFVVALLGWLPLGLGHWWMLFDARGRNWHDLASHSEVILLPSSPPA